MASAVSETQGDYEPILTLRGASDRALHWHYSTQVATGSGALRQVSVQRYVLLEDLQSGTIHHPWFNESGPQTIPGSTAPGVSSHVLRALRTSGRIELAIVDRDSSGLPAERAHEPNIYQQLPTYPLERVGTVTVPVIVNDAYVELPAIHAKGSYMGDTVELFILDDERNPLVLRSRQTSIASGGDTARTQVVKLSFRCAPAAAPTARANRIEEALARTGRAEIYDIYFAFNSARIRPESTATLEEIAAALRRHPDWRMRIDGHTDSIADDGYNLELSRRRAESVKNALATRFGIEPDRLRTDGFGEAMPKDRNDTLEGRARNRRVELVRQ